VTLTPAQVDRAHGVLLGMACGDALGAGYEFGEPFEGAVEMKGGGPFDWAPGEWTDDTSMAIVIAQALADGPLDERALDRIARGWIDWARTAPDVGAQSRAILGSGATDAATLRQASRDFHERAGRSAGNGSLMRTAPLALAFLDDLDGLIAAARTVSELTHFESSAGDACVLWCLAIRHAVLTGELDFTVGLPHVGDEWAALIETAKTSAPRDFVNNGWVVEALQGAVSAFAGGRDIRSVLESAVRGGRDTDTVAAIAGGLAGAVWGASTIPAEWMPLVHGWSALRTDDLVDLANRII
jgi:ADP-ribosylglycohydrolase